METALPSTPDWRQSIRIAIALALVVTLAVFAAVRGSQAMVVYVEQGAELPFITAAVLAYRWLIATVLPVVVIVGAGIAFAATRRHRPALIVSWCGVLLAAAWTGIALLAYSIPKV